MFGSSLRNSVSAAKTSDMPPIVSVLGLSVEIARSRLKMAKEAAGAVDLEGLQWAAGPGGLRGSDWLSQEFNEWAGKSIIEKSPTVWDKLCAAIRKGHANPALQARAVDCLATLIASGLSLQDEAAASLGGDALSRGVLLIAPMEMNTIRVLKKRPLNPASITVNWNLGNQTVSAESAQREPRQTPMIVDKYFLEAYGRAAMHSILDAGMGTDKALAALKDATDRANRHSAEELATLTVFLSSAKRALSERVTKDLLGDKAPAGVVQRGAAQRL